MPLFGSSFLGRSFGGLFGSDLGCSGFDGLGDFLGLGSGFGLGGSGSFALGLSGSLLGVFLGALSLLDSLGFLLGLALLLGSGHLGSTLGLAGGFALGNQLVGSAELVAEALNASAGVDELLLTGVEGVASAADLDADLGLGGAGLERVAAAARNRALHVIRVDSRFHFRFSFSALVSDQGQDKPLHNSTAPHRRKRFLHSYTWCKYHEPMEYESWYANISAPFRSASATRAINMLDKGLVWAIAAVYLAALAYLAFTADVRFWKSLIVPAATFAIVTVIRAALNKPRPYEEHSIDPIIKKETRGKSLPSRHLASAVIIACALAWVNLPLGIAAFAASGVVAFTRIVGGVHYPRDIVASLVISLVFGAIGFILIP